MKKRTDDKSMMLFYVLSSMICVSAISYGIGMVTCKLLMGE